MATVWKSSRRSCSAAAAWAGGTHGAVRRAQGRDSNRGHARSLSLDAGRRRSASRCPEVPDAPPSRCWTSLAHPPAQPPASGERKRARCGKRDAELAAACLNNVSA